jgi:hypothetical protein
LLSLAWDHVVQVLIDDFLSVIVVGLVLEKAHELARWLADNDRVIDSEKLWRELDAVFDRMSLACAHVNQLNFLMR